MSPASTNTFETLDQLVSLISSSVEAIKAEYAKSGSLPSLDTTEPHPYDDTEQPSFEMKRAVQILEAACGQLSATVANPYSTMLNRSSQAPEVACIRIVTETKIPDLLKVAGENGLHVSEISAKTGIEVGKLERVLRLLATKHIFREVKKNVFANNRLSILLHSDNEMSSFALHLTEECSAVSYGLYDTLTDPDYATSYAPNKTALNKVYPFMEGKTLFWWLNENDKPRGARFGRGLVAFGKAAAGDLPNSYPWASLPSGARVTDVGGGVGTASMQIARSHSHLNFTVQDLPATCDKGTEIWKEKYPEAVKSQRITFTPINFFENSPVQGAEVYYLRHIIHNWGDEECIQILSNVRKSMKPGSKVLIHDYIIQHANRVSDAEAIIPQAPEPLLPNYGCGRIREYNLDLYMLALLNAKERTLDECVKLGHAAGLKFNKVYDTGESGIVEFVLA